ncbi:hypothetical protein DSO57_1024568 [Entomophthora muscae]|uniref:Uncharacterized protein n=1 Tax=Entomophthora muscae TaxID=34485 RepID=A0ACC2S4M1_9FUNG|nr:hypothetical protein DSO57_1024568 [Entomophthora muscae]
MFGSKIGSISVTVIEARNLANEDTALVGRNDAYAYLKCNHTKAQTKVIKNAGSSCTWNETFNFEVKDDSELELSVYDQDTIKDDKIGEIKIPIAGLANNRCTEAWYGIGKGSKNRGEVLLRIQFTPL